MSKNSDTYSELVKKANKRIRVYRKSGERDALFEKEIKNLKDITGTSKRSIYLRTAKGVSSQSDIQLTRSIRELEYFLEWDLTSEDGYRQWEQREEKAYQTYLTNHPESNISKDQWRNMVEVFGALGDTIMETYGSTEMEILNESYLVNRENGTSTNTFLGVASQVYEELKGQGLSQQKLKERLMERMNELLQK